MGNMGSLDAPIETEDGELSMLDVIPSGEDPAGDVSRRLDHESMSRNLWEAVDRLPGDQPAVLRMVYREGMTRIQAGEVLGYGNGKVGLESKAMRILRQPHRCRTFRAYFEEYLSAAPIHHRGLQTYLTTWTSEVEREVLRHEKP